MASVILPSRRTRQPQWPFQIDWGNPLTRGLVFCAVPLGGTFLDLVTMVPGTVTGTVSPKAYGNAGGKSRVAAATALHGDGTNTTSVVWPVSSLRGGDIVQSGTLLALGGATESVDANSYLILANTETVSTGAGAGLAIDSYQYSGRGNIVRTNWSGAKGYSTAEALGTNFENQLHYFGYAFAGNGTDGDWLYSGSGVTWAGGTTFGTTTTNRRARVLHIGNNGFATRGMVALGQIWNRRVGVAEYAALYADPWQLFRRNPARVYFVPSAGGTVYDVSFIESVAATDSMSSSAVLAAALAESAAAGDSASSVATLTAAVTETAAATDAVSAGSASYSVSVSESVAATDAVSAALIGVAAFAESVSATDTMTAGAAVYSVSISEAAAAVDAVNAVLVSARSITESAAASDSVNTGSGSTYSVSFIESAAALDAMVAVLVGASAVSESVAAADLMSAQATLVGAIAEAAQLVDALLANGLLSVTVTETATPTDSYTAAGALGDAPASRTITLQFRNSTITLQTDGRTVRVTGQNRTIH